jgi:uronate dehydrogenase
MLSAWLSPGDLIRLAQASLDAPNAHFEVVYGVSANTRSFWRNPAADRIGFHPQDDAELFAREVLDDPDKAAELPIASLFQGGRFCAPEFGGDLERMT